MKPPRYFLGVCACCLKEKLGCNYGKKFHCCACKNYDLRLRKRLGIPVQERDPEWKEALQDAFDGTDPCKLLSAETLEALYDRGR